MATDKLNDATIQSLKPKDKEYSVADGGSLSLRVMPNGSKLWRYRFRYDGKQQMMSLGSYPTTSLKEARIKRDAQKKLQEDNNNPSHIRQTEKIQNKLDIKNDFESVYKAWFAVWSIAVSVGYADKITGMFARDILPKIGNRPVKTIKPLLIREVVQDVVNRGAFDTAKRVLFCIRAVLKKAYSLELVSENMAVGIDVNDIVPTRKTKNQVRINIKELPQLLQDIDNYNGNAITQIAVKLLALTFVRTKELINAEWSEIDFIGKVWRLPPEKMKIELPHIVPLSRQTLALLSELKKITGGSRYLLPSVKGDGKTMTNNTILYALYRMGYHSRMTGHGFRGVASTQLSEMGYEDKIIEKQLSHLYGGETKRAYDHSKNLPERTAMMQAWADYLDAQRGIGQVVKFKQA